MQHGAEGLALLCCLRSSVQFRTLELRVFRPGGALSGARGIDSSRYIIQHRSVLRRVVRPRHAWCRLASPGPERIKILDALLSEYG